MDSRLCGSIPTKDEGDSMTRPVIPARAGIHESQRGWIPTQDWKDPMTQPIIPARDGKGPTTQPVIPANAGIQGPQGGWIPACAGMTQFLA
jgi:hypothetical protein